MVTHTYIHTHTTTTITLAAHAHRGLINKRVFRVTVNTYVYLCIFRGLDARGGRKLRTDTRDTRDNRSI